MRETRTTRPISWIKAALKEFEAFPKDAQSVYLTALTIAADGGKADIAKPLRGLGSGVLEIALAFRAMRFASFMLFSLRTNSGSFTYSARKSTQGIKTPKHEIDVVNER